MEFTDAGGKEAPQRRGHGARKRDLAGSLPIDSDAVRLMKKKNGRVLGLPGSKKMEAMLPNFIDVWVDKQKQAGRGDAAAAIAKRWKELNAQLAPKS